MLNIWMENSHVNVEKWCGLFFSSLDPIFSLVPVIIIDVGLGVQVWKGRGGGVAYIGTSFSRVMNIH